MNTSDASLPRIPLLPAWGLLFCALLVMSLPGCSGCRGNQNQTSQQKKKEEEEKKKEKEKEKPDFQAVRMMVQPTDDTIVPNYVKPGHWTSAIQLMRANNFNFKGVLESAIVDRKDNIIDLELTPFRVTSSRPALLPKGQEKYLETIYYIPEASTGLSFRTQLRSSRGGREMMRDDELVSRMPAYQYFLVVLSRFPNRYGYLQNTYSVRPPADQFKGSDDILYYRVVLPETGDNRRIPLPANPLTWTSIAYLLWDEMDPNGLTPEQRGAMIEWLHWGGQLIVSGPNSLDTLRSSFLQPYLPVTSSRSTELGQVDFTELNNAWSIRDKEGQPAEIKVLKPLVGAELELTPGAEFLPDTDNLVAERRVGAGRIVVTGFPLTDRQITNWGSFDSFLNACLLRRPARRFRRIEPDLHTERTPPSFSWTDFGHDRFVQDARLVSTYRIFSRDIGVLAENTGAGPSAPLLEAAAGASESVMRPDTTQVADRFGDHPRVDDWHFNGYGDLTRTRGIGRWNDGDYAASGAARQTLKDAAGISIPRADFVFKTLAIYLVVLVPVNWFVFRMMGRVEWAWVAAPLIAVIGALAVVRLAQLDIGFASSRTEINILEVQGGFSRGHLTRYTAIYTSLGTAYELDFDDSSAIALPFANPDYKRGVYESVRDVHFRRDKAVGLSGLQIDSNSTGMVHSEQMFDLGGTFDLITAENGERRVRNQTPFAVQDAAVLHKDENGQLQVAWLGRMPAATSATLRFTPMTNDRIEVPQWRKSPATYTFDEETEDTLTRFDADQSRTIEPAELPADHAILEDFTRWDKPDSNNERDGLLDYREIRQWCIYNREEKVSLGRLFQLASERLRVNRGEYRLVGWSDDPVPGLDISPRTAQSLFRTMLLVHLQHGELPQPRPDVNLYADFVDPEKPAQEVPDIDEILGPAPADASLP